MISTPEPGQTLPRGGIGVVSDGARQGPEEARAKAGGDGVLGAPEHADIACQAADMDRLHLTFAQPAGQAGGGARALRAQVVAKGAVGIDARVAALAHDEVHRGPVDLGMQLGAGGVLDAMVGPQGLRLAVEIEGVEGGVSGMLAGEGDVLGGCQSWVATTCAKRRSPSNWVSPGRMASPSAQARGRRA